MKKKEITDETKVHDSAEDAAKKAGGIKKIKYGSMSVITIIIVVAIVAVINIMAGEMEKRRPMKIDLTGDKRYDLSDETIDVLKNLDKDVDILVTMPKSSFDTLSELYSNNWSYQLRMMNQYYGTNYNESIDVPYDMIPVILEKYEMYSRQGDGKGSVTVKYVDLSVDPDSINKYQANYSGGEITKENIVISSGDNVRVLSADNIVGMLAVDEAAMKNNTFALVFAGESRLTSDIMNVVDTNIIKTAFINTANGQNIYSTDDAAKAASIKDELLSKNGYECTDIDIIKDSLDTEKYDMLVLPMPMNDLTNESIEKIQDFLYNNEKYGKNLVYIPSLTNIDSPNLDEFLSDWSLEIEKRGIVDETYYMGSDPRNIMLFVGDKDSVGTLPNDSLPILAPMTRSILLLNKNNQNKTTPVLASSPQAYTISIAEGTENDLTMGQRLGAAISKRSIQDTVDQYNVLSSRVIVFGSSDMFKKEYIQQTGTYNNANAVVNILNIANDKEVQAVIPEKSIQQNYIAPSPAESKVIKIVIIAVSAAVALAGLAVLIRRRNR